ARPARVPGAAGAAAPGAAGLLVLALDVAVDLDGTGAVARDLDLVAVRPAHLEEPDGQHAAERHDDADGDDRLGDAALLVGVGRAPARLPLGALFAQEARLLGERRELLPLLDGQRLPADLVAQPVVGGERVRRDLLEQLHGRERAVVHLVLADD